MRDSQETTYVLPTKPGFWQRPIPVAAIILLALAIHGPLLVMELEALEHVDLVSLGNEAVPGPV